MGLFGNKTNKVEQAKAIYSKAKELDASGKFIEALAAYKEHEILSHELRNADGEITALLGQLNMNIKLKQGKNNKEIIEKAHKLAMANGMTQHIAMLSLLLESYK